MYVANKPFAVADHKVRLIQMKCSAVTMPIAYLFRFTMLTGTVVLLYVRFICIVLPQGTTIKNPALLEVHAEQNSIAIGAIFISYTLDPDLHFSQCHDKAIFFFIKLYFAISTLTNSTHKVTKKILYVEIFKIFLFLIFIIPI